MRHTKDPGLLFFSLGLVVFGSVYFLAQSYAYVCVSDIFCFRASDAVVGLFRSLEVIGYLILGVIMLMRARMAGGTEKVGALFVAVWLCMAGTGSMRSFGDTLFIVHIVVGVVAGALLMIESRDRNTTETIGRYLLGFWMVATPLAQYLAVLFSEESGDPMLHKVEIIEIRVVLGILAVMSGIFLVYTELSSTQPDAFTPPES